MSDEAKDKACSARELESRASSVRGLTHALVPEPWRDTRREVRAMRARLADLAGERAAFRAKYHSFAPPEWCQDTREDMEAVHSLLADMKKELDEMPNSRDLLSPKRLGDLDDDCEAVPFFLSKERRDEVRRKVRQSFRDIEAAAAAFEREMNAPSEFLEAVKKRYLR